MADLLREIFGQINQRYQDMGDGSHAKVVAVGGGDVDVTGITLPTTIHNGQKTVTAAGTAEALAATQALESGVVVKALADNTGNVYVGDADVDSSDGFVLAAGDRVFLEIADLATVYIDVDTDGEGVSFVGS